MAITILTPGAIPFERFRKKISATKSSALSHPAISLAKNKVAIIGDSDAAATPRLMIAVLGSLFALSLVALLLINTALTQDAFVLEHLKTQNNIVKDQRDALLRQAAAKSSPAYVAAKAKQLGMVPTTNPEFITLDPVGSHG